MTIAAGQRYKLKSGREIEVMRMCNKSIFFWECAYLEDGQVTPAGHGNRNRITFTAEFLRAHAVLKETV
jgi:hypothetical protein